MRVQRYTFHPTVFPCPKDYNLGVFGVGRLYKEVLWDNKTQILCCMFLLCIAFMFYHRHNLLYIIYKYKYINAVLYYIWMNNRRYLIYNNKWRNPQNHKMKRRWRAPWVTWAIWPKSIPIDKVYYDTNINKCILSQ